MTGRRIRCFLLAAVCAAVAAGNGRAQPSAADGPEPPLAILPFANNAGVHAADSLGTPILHRLLAERGIGHVPADNLRPVLRRHRIRSRGWIGRRGAELVAEATGARHLLIGAWEVHRAEGNIEFGVSLRVLDAATGVVVSAASEGGTGEDTVGWLDLGRVADMDSLATRVIARALDRVLPPPPAPVARLDAHGCRHFAVVPLDDYAETRNAGNIMTNILLSRLLAAGYFVVEPGFVRELGLARERMVRGGVDRASADAIRDALGVCRVITGAVETLDPARGLPHSSVPRVAAGLRVTRLDDGTIEMMRELRGDGDDRQSVFQLGRIHALIPLATDLLDRFVADIAAALREDIIHGKQP